eukprot:g21368.t2
MEVLVENASNIPEGSILSIRAGNVRRQGTLPADKPVRFAQTSLLDASPFKVDIFAPLGSKMNLDLLVRDLSSAAGETAPAPPNARGEDALSETEAYLKKHELQVFIQNLMTSVLADKPDDPFAYMAHHLGNSVKVAPPPTPSAALVPVQRRALQKKPPRLMPHKKGFDQPAFVVEDFDGKLLTLRELEAKDLLPPSAELRRLLIDDLSKVFPGKNVPSPLNPGCMFGEQAGYVEATCNANCIGLVKLMGRHSGFIALHAGLAARHADIVLLPEMTISLEKVLLHILDLMQSKGHCLVVVAEGCGDTLLQSSGEVDGGLAAASSEPGTVLFG